MNRLEKVPVLMRNQKSSERRTEGDVSVPEAQKTEEPSLGPG